MRFCGVCNEEFETVSALANHTRWKHKREQTETTCQHCGKVVNKANLSQHESRCLKHHPCEHCGTSTLNERFCSQSCAASVNNRDHKIGYAVYRKNRGIVGEPNYRDICFSHWPHKCVLCDWDLAVDVHHIDRNHDNRSPQNLVPLCQNHHKLTQLKRFRKDIDTKIAEIVKEKFDECN